MTTQSETVAASLGLTMTAEFVPLSRSRNAVKGGPKKVSDLSLNWRVTLSRGRQSMTIDYQQGIGHMPGYRWKNSYTLHEFDAMVYAAEKGRSGHDSNQLANRTYPLPPPSLADILSCLSSDASVLDCNSFEEWAMEYGYDPDSRKAESVYQECLKQSLAFRNLVGNENVSAFREE